MAQENETLKLKISKKAYVFDVRKRFAASRLFAVKKKPENPAEDLREKLKEFLGKKKLPLDGSTPGQKAAPPAGQQKALPIASGGNSMLKIGAIFLLLILVGIVALLAFIPPGGMGGAQAVPKPDVFFGTYSFSVDEAKVLTVESGDSTRQTGYLLLSYSASNLTSLNFSALLYSSQPSTQVFILDYPRDSGNSYPVFRRHLEEELAKNGIAANEIDIDMAGGLPAGAVLVVPTGYFPKELLGVDSNFDYRSLLARGVTIIYIGMPFDNQALGRDGLAVPVSHNLIAFDRKARPKSTDGFGLFNPQYAAVPASSSGLTPMPPLYGTVSAMRFGNGVMLFLPQSLDGGWRERDVSGSWSEKGELAAQDLSRLIEEERWLTEISNASAVAPLSKAAEKKLSLFTAPFDADSVFVKLAANAVDSQGTQRRSLEVFKMEKYQKGKMMPSEPQTVPYYLSGQRTRLNVALRENSTAQVKLYVEMYKDGKLLQRTDLEPGLTTPTTDKSVDIQVDAEPGNYVVLVSDEQGKVYAAGQLAVTDLEITTNESNWARGKFSFFLSSAGQPVEPRSLAVSFDGKEETRYTPSSLRFTPSASVVDYSYSGKIESGPHRFTFSIGPYTKNLDLAYDRTAPFWENPIVLVLAVMAAGVFGMGIVMRRPDAVRYGLDIPDFPPMSTIKIPIKKETVLDIFENVNASYSWQRMPLRTDEIKNGFRKLTYNGKPIIIGDFNLERILSKLIDEGEIKEEIGYFGLARWEKESKHSIHYLAIYRILRNVFVNNAVKFSKLDAMPDCDMKAIAGKEEIYLHIMEQPFELVVHRALATAKKSSTIMVFKSAEGRDAFRTSLTSISKLAVGLKMEVDGGRIMLFTAKNEISAYLKGVIR